MPSSCPKTSPTHKGADSAPSSPPLGPTASDPQPGKPEQFLSFAIPEATAADCLAALDRLALRVDEVLALVEALPPLAPAALDRMDAADEAALSSWRPPLGWWW
jgi:hypothetical protein